MANQKLTELSEDATPLDTDLTYGVKDPTGSPSSIKWAWSTLKTFLKTYFDTLYQGVLGFTPEDSANKENTTIDTSTTKYPTVNLLKTVKDIADAKMSNPMSATGDIIYGGASGVATRLAKGDDDKVLMLKSGLPSWETPASGGADIIEVQMFS